LTTPNKRVNWKRIALSFLAWFLLSGMVSIYEAIMYPGRYKVTLDIGAIIPYALFAILLIPIQTSAEELFFRGYLMQWMGLKTRNIIFLPVFTGLIFMALHFGNPEMVVASGSLVLAASYFAIGAFAAIITLLDGGLELALGLHAANNIYTALVANYTISALPSSSIFVINEIDPVFGLISLLVALSIFYFLAFIIFPRKNEN
jgi:membrane protease YdiL (CAAX protease family)